MKNINEFVNYSPIDEDLINEDAVSALILTNMWITIICQLMIVGGVGKLASSEGVFDSIKHWWKDKKIQKIVKRLANDQEVKDFLNLSQKDQRGKWQNLLKDKLSEDEQKYLHSISRDKVRNNIK